MNCDEDYNDERERAMTPDVLIPKSEGPVDPSTVNSVLSPDQRSALDRRSVLDGDDKGRERSVLWNTSSNRVDKNNAKARQRHLELVTARLMARGAAKEAAAAAQELVSLF
jgi:hypothetical protein